jgi:hypothetical protein
VIDEITAAEAVEATKWLGRQHVRAIASSVSADGAAAMTKRPSF